MNTTSSGRCAAAHPRDVTGCHGPADAVRVVTVDGEQVHGCVHHAATMLATVTGARVYPASVPGAAIDAYLLAASRQPFDFNQPPRSGSPRPPQTYTSAGVGAGRRLVLPLDHGQVLTVIPQAGGGRVRLLLRGRTGTTTVALTAEQAAAVAGALADALPTTGGGGGGHP